MKAILLNEAGGVENLVYGDIDQPILKKGEILVKVKAIGINPADAKARSNDGFLTSQLGDKRPAILG